jgi:hypothetical protein
MCPNCNVALKVTLNQGKVAVLQCEKCAFITFPNRKVLDEIFAWVSVDPVTNFEGIITMNLGPLGCIPAVTSEYNLIKKFKEIIERQTKIQTASNTHVVRFKRDGIILL